MDNNIKLAKDVLGSFAAFPEEEQACLVAFLAEMISECRPLQDDNPDQIQFPLYETVLEVGKRSYFYSEVKKLHAETEKVQTNPQNLLGIE